MDRLVDVARTAMRGSLARQTAIANNLGERQHGRLPRGDLSMPRPAGSAAEVSIRAAESVDQVIGADVEGRQRRPDRQSARHLGGRRRASSPSRPMTARKAIPGAATCKHQRERAAGRPVTAIPCMGGSGPITLPPADSVSDRQGRRRVDRAARRTGRTSPSRSTRSRLVNPKGSAVAKGTDNLFREVNGGVLPDDPLCSA